MVTYKLLNAAVFFLSLGMLVVIVHALVIHCKLRSLQRHVSILDGDMHDHIYWDRQTSSHRQHPPHGYLERIEGIMDAHHRLLAHFGLTETYVGPTAPEWKILPVDKAAPDAEEKAE